MLEAPAIAGASDRLDALVIGHVGLSRALGIREAGATDGTILHARCLPELACPNQPVVSISSRAGSPGAPDVVV